MIISSSKFNSVKNNSSDTSISRWKIYNMRNIRRMKMIKIAAIILGIITISMIACILCTSVIAGKRADESIERYFKEQKKG